ncbi:Permease of the drug/metabolite transporter (DMT) superfamily [Natronorubrum texcoconense]|uniref:Permease of the drug/metabolite transporter (DMT) superfamily n=1 Tax=Natronorubrum texcoconense TaxID=1095776 RepID=A0A1G8TAM8_9EURY|nr:Permease of the drug/metabolite transporter (DMT) superfamily [Natronorubrum texcoconense]
MRRTRTRIQDEFLHDARRALGTPDAHAPNRGETVIDRRTAVFFVLSSVFFGGTFVAAKAGLEYFPPLLFVAIRFDIAALVMLGYVALTASFEELRPRTRGDVVGILATGGLVIGLSNALLFVGQQYATSAVGAIVFSLNPILTPVFAAVLLSNERLSHRGAFGMVLGLVGVALVVSPDPAMLVGGDALGRAILFAGAASAALGAVLIRRSGGNATLSSTVRIAWGLPIAAALSHGLAWSAGESMGSIAWTTEALVALAYVSLVAGVLAYIAYFGLLESTGATQANLVFYVVPVVSTIGGWALLGETIAPLAVVGFLTIFAGFAVIGSESSDVRSLLPERVVRTPAVEESPAREEPRGYRSD